MMAMFAMSCLAGVSVKHIASTYVPARVLASIDTVFIHGDSLSGRTNSGALERTINQDTLAGGVRINPNRVYALNEGQVYFQQAPICFNDPNARLIIVGVPSSYGTQKPIILMDPQLYAPILSNIVYGSIEIRNIHWQAMQLDGNLNYELFVCGTGINQGQSLTIDNCLFEFSNVDLFDCTDELGAIGGWTHGASFRITNSYFRDLFCPFQWWDSRIFQCRHPIDTMWIENNTITGGGITIFQSNQLTDFQFINHNTILNNKKYWLNSPYHHITYITNNIFVNQNWVGEDTNVLSCGVDPDNSFGSTINVDTNSAAIGEIVQPKFILDPTHFTDDLSFENMRVYVADNINYYDPLLVNGYYESDKYKLASLGALPSYINWCFSNFPFPVENVPCQWMNKRTQSLFNDHRGAFIEERTSAADPGLVTPAIADASVVDSMAAWNQNMWGDPRFPQGVSLCNTRYIFGDYDPTTIPGVKTEDGSGITKFTDLTENFKPTLAPKSGIDGFPIGSLIWDDVQNASFVTELPEARFALAHVQYDLALNTRVGIGSAKTGTPQRYGLSQNYPNPCNPSTNIGYTIASSKEQVAGSTKQVGMERVRLVVYDLLGREVAVLVDGYQTPGEHRVTFDARSLASGIYFYRLIAGGVVQTRKMALVR